MKLPDNVMKSYLGPRCSSFEMYISPL